MPGPHISTSPRGRVAQHTSSARARPTAESRQCLGTASARMRAIDCLAANGECAIEDRLVGTAIRPTGRSIAARLATQIYGAILRVAYRIDQSRTGDRPG